MSQRPRNSLHEVAWVIRTLLQSPTYFSDVEFFPGRASFCDHTVKGRSWVPRALDIDNRKTEHFTKEMNAEYPYVNRKSIVHHLPELALTFYRLRGRFVKGFVSHVL